MCVFIFGLGSLSNILKQCCVLSFCYLLQPSWSCNNLPMMHSWNNACVRQCMKRKKGCDFEVLSLESFA